MTDIAAKVIKNIRKNKIKWEYAYYFFIFLLHLSLHPTASSRNIPLTPFKGGIAEWYQSEWSMRYFNMLKISVIVQRFPIPLLREVRESGVCEGGCNEFYGDVKKTWGCNGAM